jgi:hypothetical protein
VRDGLALGVRKVRQKVLQSSSPTLVLVLVLEPQFPDFFEFTNLQDVYYWHRAPLVEYENEEEYDIGLGYHTP